MKSYPLLAVFFISFLASNLSSALTPVFVLKHFSKADQQTTEQTTSCELSATHPDVAKLFSMYTYDKLMGLIEDERLLNRRATAEEIEEGRYEIIAFRSVRARPNTKEMNLYRQIDMEAGPGFDRDMVLAPTTAAGKEMVKFVRRACAIQGFK